MTSGDGGYVIPEEFAGELIQAISRGEAVYSYRAIGWHWQPTADQLRAELAEAEAQDALQLRAHLLTLNPTRWYRR